MPRSHIVLLVLVGLGIAAALLGSAARSEFTAAGVSASSGAEGATSAGSAALSHLLPHLDVLPPARLLRPLGDERPESIVKGYDSPDERALTDALLAAGLHGRLLKVGVASNGSLTAAMIKLQAGDKQSGLFSVSDAEEDAARVITTAFTRLPALGYVDLWLTVPWLRDAQPVHRPVFSVSVARESVADLLGGADDPKALLARCGKVRLEAALLDYAIDATDLGKVRPTSGDVLAGPAIDQDWLRFSAESSSAGELSALRGDGPVPVVLSGPRSSRAVSLTIDDGPHPLVTPLMLDILRRANVKATFFVVGELVEQYPELARMIVRDGHELGNHTYSHIPLTGLNPRGVWAQLRGCEVAVQRACGVKLRWFRPPGGDCTEETLRGAQALGYTTVLWTDNAGDWRDIGSSAITANALQGLGGGGIILMHQDGVESVKALSAVIAGAQALGLSLGTVSDAAGDGSIVSMKPADLLPLMRRSHIDW